MPFLTIFTAPKPFSDPHIATIQRNAIQSWLHIGEEVEVLLIGEETGMAEVASEFGIRHLAEVDRNREGTPLVSSIFELARQHSDSHLLSYINADILILPDFLRVAKQIASLAERFLVVGQRWDLDIRQELDFIPGWESRLQDDLGQRGRLHPPAGSDYFIFPRACFMEMPAFAIGRAGWDNWMFFHARQKWPVINAAQAIKLSIRITITATCPENPVRLPETFQNIRLAGGRRAIFTLQDADCALVDGDLQRIPLRGAKFWREVETFPLTRFHSRPLGELAFTVFHPLKAWGEWKGRLDYKLKELQK
jgi:hypothetical protein